MKQQTLLHTACPDLKKKHLKKPQFCSHGLLLWFFSFLYLLHSCAYSCKRRSTCVARVGNPIVSMAFASLSWGNIWSTVSNSASTSSFVTATVVTWKSGAWINLLRLQSVVSNGFWTKDISNLHKIARFDHYLAAGFLPLGSSFGPPPSDPAMRQGCPAQIESFFFWAINHHSKNAPGEFKHWDFGSAKSVLQNGGSKHLIGTCLTCLDLSH